MALPGGKLAHVLTVLVAVNAALASFLLVRRAKGIGYSIGWGKRWGLYVVGSFLAFACIAIPLGIALHFIAFAPQWSRWGTYVGAFAGNPDVYGVAGRIAVSGVAAEFSVRRPRRASWRDGGLRPCFSDFRTSRIWDFPIGGT